MRTRRRRYTLTVCIAEKEKLPKLSNYFIMDGNSTVYVATYKLSSYVMITLTEHLHNLISIPPKELLILNRTLIKTNLFHVCFRRDSPSPPSVRQGLLIHQVSRSHTTDASQSVGLFRTSYEPVAETST